MARDAGQDDPVPMLAVRSMHAAPRQCSIEGRGSVETRIATTHIHSGLYIGHSPNRFGPCVFKWNRRYWQCHTRHGVRRTAASALNMSELMHSLLTVPEQTDRLSTCRCTPLVLLMLCKVTCGGSVDDAGLRQQGLQLQHLLPNLAGFPARIRDEVLCFMALHNPWPNVSLYATTLLDTSASDLHIWNTSQHFLSNLAGLAASIRHEVLGFVTPRNP